MELSTVETTVVAKAVVDANQAQLNELCDLQLAMVGGGIGEVVVG